MGARFDYVSGQTGLSRITSGHSGWGAKFIDYDNDGWKDLFVAQGHVMDNIELTQPSTHYRESLLLMRNVKGKFEDISNRSGEVFRLKLPARGAAFGDLNNDGGIDVAINCNDGPAMVVMNRGGNGNCWLIVNTVGTESNRDGVGAEIRLVSSLGQEQYGYVSTAGSYASACDKRVHFGLGAAVSVASLEIKWPSGAIQKLENIKADRVIAVREPA